MPLPTHVPNEITSEQNTKRSIPPVAAVGILIPHSVNSSKHKVNRRQRCREGTINNANQSIINGKLHHVLYKTYHNIKVTS